MFIASLNTVIGEGGVGESILVSQFPFLFREIYWVSILCFLGICCPALTFS